MHKFAIPEDFWKIVRSVIASLVDPQTRELPGRFGRVGNYAIYRASRIPDLSTA